jgi:pantetheine-phosphate adenylyltransferase
MRIIAGFLGGRRLPAKVVSGTRPTSDRVREALGSVLAGRGAFEDARVLDLFAGTGALGLEAISRGAREVLAIDSGAAALRGLEQNVRELGVESQLRHRKLDLLQRPERVLEALLASMGKERTAFSLVFADPPYRELPRFVPLLAALAQHPAIREDALFGIEHARDNGSQLQEIVGLRAVGHYLYGDTAITLLARAGQIGEGEANHMASKSAVGSRPSAAIYAGSFDPITNGHVAVIRSGLVAFERIIVAVLTNTAKKPLFSVEERTEFIRDAVSGMDIPDSANRVEVDRFDDGLLVDYARKKDVHVLLRGLRAVGDFEHELQMANMNRHLAPGIETVFIMTDAFFYVSSTLIKEAAKLGGNLHGMVPELVENKLREKFGR